MQIHEFNYALDSSPASMPIITAVDRLRYQVPSELRRNLEASQLALWGVWHEPGTSDVNSASFSPN